MREELLKLHRSDVGADEVRAVTEVLQSGWLTKGPRTRRFEAEFAARVGGGRALGVNSCTAALHLALLSAGAGPGDEVIVPAQTFAASANVVVHCGATPVFADVLPETHTIDPAHVESLITPSTRAVIPVHFAGIPAELDAIWALAERHGLFVLEDCAHAVEAEYRGRPVGVGAGDTPTRFAAYSFYATKNLVCGEGGMLCCRDLADHDRATVMGLHGMSANAWKRYSGADGAGGGFNLYDIIAAGYKYNMFDLQAALGLVQLAKLDANWERRRRLVEHYDALVADIDGVTPLSYPEHVKPAHHLYIVRLDADRVGEAAGGEGGWHVSPGRDRVINGLRARNVESYVHYVCLTATEFYREQYGTSPADTPVAAELARRSITLPLFPDMALEDVNYVVASLKDVLAE